jgi:hypothetical protein
VLAGFGLAVVLVLPAFGLLYRLDQSSLLPEEGAPSPAGARSDEPNSSH